MLTSDIQNSIILFDGVCNYCNSMVNFAIRNNSKRDLRFAPLQSPVGMHLKEKFAVPPEVDSVVFIENSKAYIYADAALHICRHLDWPAKALYIFTIIPSFVSNAIYKWVARNRYKWFGKKDSCMVPPAEIKSLFLDTL